MSSLESTVAVATESSEKFRLDKQIGGTENPLDDSFSLETIVGHVEVRSDMGGEKSKYARNEDSAFVVCDRNVVTCGVIDGAGGSGDGYVASSVANIAYREAILSGLDFQAAFSFADEQVRRQKEKLNENIYATATAVQIKKAEKPDEYQLDVMCIGDAKTMTVRGGIILREATTEPQNVAYFKLHGTEDEKYYYVHRELSRITGSLGGPNSELYTKASFLNTIGNSGDIIVMASDGFWDNISEYEVLEIVKSLKHDSKAIEQKLFDLAHERNNSTESFVIQHDAENSVEKTINGPAQKRGDNITVAVIGLK